MFCKKCGKELSDGVRFCANCGTPVESNVATKKDNPNAAPVPVGEAPKANAEKTASAGEAPKVNPEKTVMLSGNNMNQPVNNGMGMNMNMNQSYVTPGGPVDTPKKKKSPVGLIIAIIVVLLALVGGGLAYYFLVMAPKAAIESKMEEADEYLDDENYRKAISAYKEVLELDPENVDAYIGLAQAYVGKGDYESAIELLEDAVKDIDDKELEDLLKDIQEEYEDSMAASSPAVTVEPEPAPEPTPAPTPAPAPEPQPIVVTAAYEPPSTDGWDDSKKIYYYSWNDEFGSRMEYVLNAYPQYRNYVEYVNLGCSGVDGTYQELIYEAMVYGNEYPSLFACDNDILKYYTESDDTLSMGAIGITDEMYANAYQYTIDYATYNGELKALTWQATPGCFVYRASIAEEVLGVSDPEDVQYYVRDWDAFLDTAYDMRSAGYYMLSGPYDVRYAMWDQQTNPWVTVAADGTETLTLDSSVSDYLELAKYLYDGGYTDGARMWSDRWCSDFEGDVFGYFGCTWFAYWCIATWEDSPTSTYGDWRVCAGPVAYHWGGTYIVVGKDCPNVELAAFLLYSLCCDEEIMYDIAVDTLDYVNNQAVIEREIANGEGASAILGGQNPLEIWAEVAPNIDLSNSCYLDADIKWIIDDASEAYNVGYFSSVDEAIEFIKEEIALDYPYIYVD